MAEEPEPGITIAETTVAYDQFRLDPHNYSDDGQEPSPVWESSERLRELVDKADPNVGDTDRKFLSEELQRQLRMLRVLVEFVKVTLAAKDKSVSLIVLLFPGEGRDNTGIKDLNDKVLGYKLTSEFVALRQQAIRDVFKDSGSGPGYVTSGQDYKSAFILARGKTGKDLAADLVLLDGKLREHLLTVLAKAEDEAKKAKDTKRLDAIRKLQKALKDKKYRFDFLVGMNTIGVAGKPLTQVLLLITEAVKGAGLARFAAKARQAKSGLGKGLGGGRGIETVPKGHDSRVREYVNGPFLRTAKAAEDIKDAVVKSNLNNVFINTVWTKAFTEVRTNIFLGTADMIRDVRKKLLEQPPATSGINFKLADQIELLEMWLVALNLIDFIKEFTAAEAFGPTLDTLHTAGMRALAKIEDPNRAPIDWPALTKLLTLDVQQQDPLSVLGTASEFQFYSRTSDFRQQIIFTFDVRDLGVDLMTYYEVATREIVFRAPSGTTLMRLTFRATDPIVLRKRFTHASIFEVFRKYHSKLAKDAQAQAHKAFGGAVAVGEPMPDFRSSVRVMLGGDEFFVSAHPLYAAHVHEIIRDLDAIVFDGDIPLNMRAGVAFSSAEPRKGARGPTQKRNNQIAHDRAMKLSGDSAGMLKQLERAHRRIELLIEKLEANEKKKGKAPGYRKRLAELRLLKKFARVQYLRPVPISDDLFGRLRRLLKAEDLKGAVATGTFELVDFDGTEVDVGKLLKRIQDLESAARRDVGLDNFRIDFPDVPPWVLKLINKISDFLDKIDEAEEKEKAKPKVATA